MSKATPREQAQYHRLEAFGGLEMLQARYYLANDFPAIILPTIFPPCA
ncbi:MAG: hypothetical protein ACR5LF_15085 [Symbiopectobacterium sp.]